MRGPFHFKGYRNGGLEGGWRSRPVAKRPSAERAPGMGIPVFANAKMRLVLKYQIGVGLDHRYFILLGNTIPAVGGIYLVLF